MSLIRKFQATGVKGSEIVMLTPDVIKRDPRLQMRAGDSADVAREVIDEQVRRLVAAMEDGAHLDPVEIVKIDGYYFLAHGWNRLAAYEKIGADEIPAIITEGAWLDALRIAWAANSKNGQPLTDTDKRRKVNSALDYYEERGESVSGYDIARETGVTASFVSKIRKERMNASPESPAEPSAPRTVTVRRGGREYQMSTERIGRKTTASPAEPPAQNYVANSGNDYRTAPRTESSAVVSASFVPARPTTLKDIPCISLVACLTRDELSAMSAALEAYRSEDWARKLLDANEALQRTFV